MTKNSLPLVLTISIILSGCVKQPVDTPSPPTINDQVSQKKSVPCLDQVAFGFPMALVPQVGNSFRCVESNGIGYALEINPRSKTPMWVAEHLVANKLKKTGRLRLIIDSTLLLSISLISDSSGMF